MVRVREGGATCSNLEEVPLTDTGVGLREGWAADLALGWGGGRTAAVSDLSRLVLEVGLGLWGDKAVFLEGGGVSRVRGFEELLKSGETGRGRFLVGVEAGEASRARGLWGEGRAGVLTRAGCLSASEMLPELDRGELEEDELRDTDLEVEKEPAGRTGGIQAVGEGVEGAAGTGGV